MEKMTVLGVQQSNFTPEGETREVQGKNLFLGYERKGVEGIACQRTYVTDAKLDGQKVKPGDVVGLLYNRWGKVEEITVEASA